MHGLNAMVSPFVLGAIDQLIETEGVSRERLARAVSELSRLFTKERTGLRRRYLDEPALGAAYLQYFLPVNLSKIQVLLDEAPVMDGAERLTVLDVGCGPGTGALAVLDWWHRRCTATALSVYAIDNSPSALRQARQLWDGYCRRADVAGPALELRDADVERQAWMERVQQKAPFDVIIVANCLNEIYSDTKDPIAARTGFASALLPWLSPHGTLMLVEPALRETSRALHQVRDRLLQEKQCTVYSPCLHENNCPALVNPDDWCHEERAWEPPAGIREIDEEVGFIKDALKFSYLLLRKDGKTIVERQPDVYRVVSELRELKGDTRVWVCNELGRSEIGRLDRAESKTNKALEDCWRGTIVKVEGLKRKDGATLGRIPIDGRVEIIRPI